MSYGGNFEICDVFERLRAYLHNHRIRFLRSKLFFGNAPIRSKSLAKPGEWIMKKHRARYNFSNRQIAILLSLSVLASISNSIGISLWLSLLIPA